jgi:hypothetical protein
VRIRLNIRGRAKIHDRATCPWRLKSLRTRLVDVAEAIMHHAHAHKRLLIDRVVIAPATDLEPFVHELD